MEKFIESLRSDIQHMSNVKEIPMDLAFTEYVVEKLESIGTIDGVISLSYKKLQINGNVDWQINGYSFDNFNDESHYDSVNLFITLYQEDRLNTNVKILKEDVDKLTNRLKRFVISALANRLDIDQSQVELIDLVKNIYENKQYINSFKFYLFVSGVYERVKENFQIEEKEVFVEVVDVARLYRITELTTDHEPIHLILSDYGYDGLPCLDVPTKTKEYNCFLSIIPGGLLADLYKEYSGQLLESNIRAFLGSKNKYNKGIKETICRKPHMFLPYNNGISATAKSVVLRNINGVKCIAEIDDLQIVNGGQTTASMYFTRKEHKCSLDEVFVQMKLTIILNEDRRGEIVPDIAKYANSQSKVTDLDLESNNEKFLAIEHLSRRMYVCKPGENPNDKCVLWYFERTNGQFKTYLNKLGRSSDAAVKKFKAQNPHKFVKSDIAKYIKIWQRLPHIVVLGSQKCFNKYKDELKKKDFQIGEKYYKKIIANAILFREADSLYGRGDKAKGDGSIKSVIVAYTLAYFHVLTDNRLDLWDIYDKQIVPKLVLSAISDLMDFVLYKFATLPNKKEGQMYTELGKKEETWKYFQTIEYDVDLLQKLEIHLVSKEERDYRDIEDEVVDIDIEAKYLLISDIEKNAKLWTGLLEWGKIVGDYEEEKYRKLLNKIVERLKVNGEFKTEELKLAKIILDYLKDNSSKRKAIKADGDNIIIQMDSYEMYQRVRDVNDIELVTNLENAQNVYKITKQEGQQLLSGVKQIKNGYYMQRILLKDLYNKLEKIGCKL